MDLEGFFPYLKIAQNITLVKRNANEHLSFFRRIITLFSFSLSERDLLSIVSLLALKTVLLKLWSCSTSSTPLQYWPSMLLAKTETAVKFAGKDHLPSDLLERCQLGSQCQCRVFFLKLMHFSGCSFVTLCQGWAIGSRVAGEFLFWWFSRVMFIKIKSTSWILINHPC